MGRFQVYGDVAKVERTKESVRITLVSKLDSGPHLMSVVLRIYADDSDAQLGHIIACRIGRTMFATGKVLRYIDDIPWLDLTIDPKLQIMPNKN